MRMLGDESRLAAMIVDDQRAEGGAAAAAKAMPDRENQPGRWARGSSVRSAFSVGGMIAGKNDRSFDAWGFAAPLSCGSSGGAFALSCSSVSPGRPRSRSSYSLMKIAYS